MATEGHPLSGAKWCPQCGQLNTFDSKKCPKSGCKYEFGESDVAGWRLQELRTVPAVLQADEIPARVASFASQPEEVLPRDDDRKALLRRLGWVAIGAVSSIALWVIGAGIATERSGDPRGGGLLGFVLLVAVLGGIGTVIGLAQALQWYFNPPKFKKPGQVAKCFFKELLGDDPGSVTRAWACLDVKAKEEFGSLDAFRAYWVKAKAELRESAIAASKQLLDARPEVRRGWSADTHISYEPPKVAVTSDTAADMLGEIVVSVFEKVETGRNPANNQPSYAYVYHGRYVWPQHKTILRGSERWYLTSGTLDMPVDAGQVPA